MTRRHLRRKRRGATLVESAIIYSVTLLIMIGLIVGGLGLFRYQQVASMSREGARWASVHGAEYEVVTNQPAATAEDVYNNAIITKAVAMDPGNITYSVVWNPDNMQGSSVSVTVNYQWIPEAYFGGVTLTSTSTMPMSY
jgi:Flp pilus assembly protein TadG